MTLSIDFNKTWRIKAEVFDQIITRYTFNFTFRATACGGFWFKCSHGGMSVWDGECKFVVTVTNSKVMNYRVFEWCNCLFGKLDHCWIWFKHVQFFKLCRLSDLIGQ